LKLSNVRFRWKGYIKDIQLLVPIYTKVLGKVHLSQ
jgi:hypothetical protein